MESIITVNQYLNYIDESYIIEELEKIEILTVAPLFISTH